MNFSGLELEPFAAAARVFSSLALTAVYTFTFKGAARVESFSPATASSTSFGTLGVAPLNGRVITGEATPEIVISERLWRRLLPTAILESPGAPFGSPIRTTLNASTQSSGSCHTISSCRERGRTYGAHSPTCDRSAIGETESGRS